MPIIKKHVGHALLHLLFPSQCLACSIPLKDTAPLCPTCIDNFPVIRQKVCLSCSMPIDPGLTTSQCEECRKAPPPFTELRALSFYKDTMTELIHALKFKKRWSAADVIAGFLLKHTDPRYFEVDALIPVPLHRTRLKKRGYNQSSLILKKISRHYGIPVLEHALKRKKNTTPQSLLPKADRVENMKDAFELGFDAGKISGQRVLLFDDVTTTGHTVSEAALVLQKAAPASIRVLTAAKSL